MPIFAKILALLFSAATILVADAGATVLGQEQEDRDIALPAENQALRVGRDLNEVARRQWLSAIRIEVEQWSRENFGSQRASSDALERALAERIHELNATCGLTPLQTRKLRVAGAGDIKRFMDRVEPILQISGDPKSSVDELRDAANDLSALRTSVQSKIFGESSLFSKTLANTLDADQKAQLERAQARECARRYELAIERAIDRLRANLWLSKEQCARLSTLLATESRPPRVFGSAPDVALVLFQASRLPESKIRPIFDESQWRTFQHWTSAYAAPSRGETALERNGFVFEPAPTSKPPAGAISETAPQNGESAPRNP
jgi:hypothetical protein